MSTSESTTTTAVVTPRETPTSGVVEAKIGDTVTATNKNDGSQATIKVSDARDAQPEEYDPEPEHDRLLAVDVTVTNVSAETYDTNPYFFNVIDTSGRRYDYSAFGGTDFNAATLNPGETITGTIVFDAPAGQVKVAYLPGLSQVLVTWSVS